MKKNSLTLNDEKAQLKERAKTILNNCKAEIRDFRPEEQDEYNSIIKQIENINTELRDLDSTLSLNNNQTNLKNSNMENQKEFRLIKAINDVANNRSLDEVAQTVIKQGAEEMRNSGLSYGGQIQIPVGELRDGGVVSFISADQKAEIISRDVYNLLEPLRAKNVLIQAGAKFLSNLQGEVVIPSMSATNVSWEGEYAPAQAGGTSETFNLSAVLSPKRLCTYIDVSKLFLLQTSFDAEQVLKRDLINAINSKLESTILGNGSGNGYSPKGLFYSSSPLTQITDFKGLCDLEASVEDANVLGESVYVMSNKAKAAFRNMTKSSKTTQLVYEGGTIDGTPVFNTSNVYDKCLAFGDWSQLCIGQWGGIDLLVDPYSKAAEGMVRIVINTYFDAKLLRPEAIKVATV